MHKGVVLDDKAVDFIGSMMPVLNEKQRRLFLAKISDYYGYGSAKELSQLTGVSQKTISKAKVEFKDAIVDPRARPHSDELGGIRAPGAGRKSILETNPEIWLALEELLDGNPQSPIKWTTKSLRNLENDLLTKGIPTSHVTIGKILESKGYSLQQNKKYTESGNPGPDRDAQFQFISRTCQDAIECGLPVISIDAKKKENLGDFQNKGKEYRPKGEPRLGDYSEPPFNRGRDRPQQNGPIRGRCILCLRMQRSSHRRPRYHASSRFRSTTLCRGRLWRLPRNGNSRRP